MSCRDQPLPLSQTQDSPPILRHTYPWLLGAMFASYSINVSIGRAAGKTESKCYFAQPTGFEFVCISIAQHQSLSVVLIALFASVDCHGVFQYPQKIVR